MNVYFDSGFRQRNASAAEVRRSNRNATFQRHNRSWLDVGRCQACKSYGARFVTVDRNENLTQQSITRARYDDSLMRVDVSKSVDVPCEMYGWLFWSRAVHVTVVSRTLNWTRENQKEKPLTRVA